jgi:hypothetical protein
MHIFRLPVSLHKLELGTFTSVGFSNLTAAAPISEESEQELVLCLIKELNDLFATGLSTEPIVDRFLDDEVFDNDPVTKKQLLLIGSSHLRRITEHLDTEKWDLHELCSGGFRISDYSVAELTAKVDTLKKSDLLKDCTAIIQLYDNSVYQVGGPGGTRHLPVSDTRGHYHIDGPLLVADKAGVQDLTSQLTPLIKTLAGIRKIFLTPLARYWLKPCCGDEGHHVNFHASGYLPALGSNIFRLRDYIRDALYTKRTANFRVLCPNRMLGIGAHLSDEDAQRIGGLWGPDPVHPSQDAYKILATSIEDDLLCSKERYTNPPKEAPGNVKKKPRIDLAETRQEWVAGCSATLPRKDTISGGGRRDSSVSSGRGRSFNRDRGGGRGRGGGKGDYRSFHWKRNRSGPIRGK